MFLVCPTSLLNEKSLHLVKNMKDADRVLWPQFDVDQR